MRCPFCGHEESVVKDSRPTDEHTTIRRRRLCVACGSRFSTVERVSLRELTVIKKNGETEAFKADKLGRSIRLALHKRPVPSEQTERILNSLIRQLEILGEGDVPSRVIGEKVMEVLSTLDSVAYIRFASVYQNFQEPKDFETWVQRVSLDAKESSRSREDID